MNKSIITVPRGIRYISEWGGFTLPEYPVIIDKKLTGCGFTEYCISCPKNVIVCSPRIILLENKESQHKGELYYVKNDLEKFLNIDAENKSIMGDNTEDVLAILKPRIKEAKTDVETETASYYKNLRDSIRHYYLERNSEGLPCKFIVTYDSFRHVKEALVEAGVFEDFYVVVDEFQSIFTDSRFKSTTEIGFLRQLDGVQRLCYVSATPMIEEYLDRLPEFNWLPFVSFDWTSEDPGRVISPKIIAKPCASILTAIKPIMESYLSGNFDKVAFCNHENKIVEIESKELIIYVNSVKNICDIIRKYGLTLENTNVLCSRTSENYKKVKKAFGCKGKIEVLGRVPKRDEPHKMFTLCTRTVYLGADFYSTCARTVILSDSNIDCLAVDISLDLPQILGRQRLDINPWKNRAELFFKVTKATRRMTKEDYDAIIEKKLKDSHTLLDIYNDLYKKSDEKFAKEVLAKKYESATKVTKYSDDYVAVDIKTGIKYPVLNLLVLVAEQRAFDVQQLDYKDRVSVFNAIERDNGVLGLSSVSEYIDIVDTFTTFQDKLRYLCELSFNIDETLFELILTQVPLEIKNYIKVFGPERLKSFCYKRNLIQKEYDKLYTKQQASDVLSEEIYKRFEVGKRYKKSDIKQLLGEVFESVGVKNMVPKANMIEEYFETRSILINDSITKKRDSGFELLSKLK